VYYGNARRITTFNFVDVQCSDFFLRKQVKIKPPQDPSVVRKILGFEDLNVINDAVVQAIGAPMYAKEYLNFVTDKRWGARTRRVVYKSVSETNLQMHEGVGEGHSWYEIDWAKFREAYYEYEKHNTSTGSARPVFDVVCVVGPYKEMSRSGEAPFVWEKFIAGVCASDSEKTDEPYSDNDPFPEGDTESEEDNEPGEEENKSVSADCDSKEKSESGSECESDNENESEAEEESASGNDSEAESDSESEASGSDEEGVKEFLVGLMLQSEYQSLEDAGQRAQYLEKVLPFISGLGSAGLVKNFLGALGYGEAPQKSTEALRQDVDGKQSWIIGDVSDLARALLPVSSNHFAFDFSDAKSLVDVNKVIKMPEGFSQAEYGPIPSIFGFGFFRSRGVLDTARESCFPLLLASLFGHTDVVDVLLTRLNDGIDVNQVGWNGESALHAAASNGHIEIVHTLLGKMSLEALAFETGEGKAALTLAVERGHPEVVVALKSKCGSSAGSGVSDTLLSLAARNNRPEVVDLLLGCGELPQNACGIYGEWLPVTGAEEFVDVVLRYCRFLSRCGCVAATRITAETPEHLCANGHTAVHHAVDLIQPLLKVRMSELWTLMFSRQQAAFGGGQFNGFEEHRSTTYSDSQGIAEHVAEIVTMVRSCYQRYL
jgi:hypothetical protein